ncbi:hypothetical protein [Flavobacterium sp.]|uniref:hypothetical protein n=1 Tax=Flavobacterium sp. TaxID=239 RepID=UPI0037508C44
MNKQKFDPDKFRRDFNIESSPLQPYNYERYLAVNNNLTKEVYEFLRSNHSEWKILCGIGVHYRYCNLHLDEVWNVKGSDHYKESDIYKYRYRPEIYLSLDTW